VADSGDADTTGTQFNTTGSHAITIGPRVDDIRTEYHPNSGRATVTTRVEDGSAAPHTPMLPPEDEPWWPSFKSREEFELAEILLETSMNTTLMDRLLKLIQSCISGKGKLTFTNHKEVQAAWDRAAQQLPPVRTSHYLSIYLCLLLFIVCIKNHYSSLYGEKHTF
jgi:hypothetical protein